MAACSRAARRLCLAACLAAAHAIVASTTQRIQTGAITQRPAAIAHQALFPILRPCNAVRTCAIVAVEKSGETDVEAKAPEAWYADSPPAVEGNSGSETGEAAMTPPEPDLTALTFSDIENTKWKLLVQPREEGWMQGGEQYHEFTLLSDGSVVWGEKAGGIGVKGRWTLKDGLLEVIRTTPLGILTGRDYYMIPARAEVTKTLQFGVRGVIRSYNAFYPVAVVADFAAVRQKGRFKFDVPHSDAAES